MRGEVGSAEVDADGLVPLIGLEVVDWCPHAVDAGIGEHEVEPAILTVYLRDEASHVRLFRRIRGHDERAAAIGSNGVGDLVEFVAGARHENDRRAFMCEGPGGGLAKPGAGARYECNLAIKFHGPPPGRQCPGSVAGSAQVSSDWPPSIQTGVPVMWLASSDARNATTFATSAGSAGSPPVSGM
jgi:hypothetical protein